MKVRGDLQGVADVVASFTHVHRLGSYGVIVARTSWAIFRQVGGAYVESTRRHWMPSDGTRRKGNNNKSQV